MLVTHLILICRVYNANTIFALVHTINQYNIDIYRDETYTPGSSDNVQDYELVYIPAGEYHPHTMIGIRVLKGGEQLKTAIISATGGATGVHPNTVGYEEDRLVLCCGDTVCCLSLPGLEMLWRTKADTITCFEVFIYQGTYIVHGELEISRIDYDGNIIWQRTGADIFVTPEGENDFQMTDNYIIAKDWSGRAYVFDYDGKDQML